MEDPNANMTPTSNPLKVGAIRLVITVMILMVLGFGVGYLEYQTNLLASNVGAYLATTNDRRSSSGRIWDQMASEQEVRASLPDTLTVDVHNSSGLTDLVRNNRISVDRIPETGLPGYYAIQTDRTNDGGDALDVARIVEASRLQETGSAILRAAQFDPSPYLSAAREQAQALNRQTGIAQPDTSGADSLAAVVIQAMTDVLVEEKVDQIGKQTGEDWRAGAIQQIFLNRDLGDYRGEVYYHDVERPSLLFTLSIQDVHAIFKVPQETTP